MHACHLFMGRWVSFGDREPSDRALLAELPPQPSEPALPAARRRVFSPLFIRGAATRSIPALSTSVMT